MPTVIKRPSLAKSTEPIRTSKPSRGKTAAEDRVDLRELNAAILRNGGKPGRPWALVKKELGLS